ncbi:DUF6634 family protein [Bosea vaviloviae]|uniref:Uncharacterized protein n=1 Tax=Bosea vaviloviae TaxID=1526658 RepID=A0A0N1N2T1_9HYPH|nr:DUF6634 family protein [Bosea vaviloviae]KPH81418.1 hypothetical protein AE618_08810 [Bosea vaviloviae]
MRTLEEKRAAAIEDLRRLKDGWRPTEADLLDAVGIERWEVRGSPGTREQFLWGFAINHPRLGNQLIRTSKVLWISEDCTVARTFSRWYRLGERAKPMPIEPATDEPEADALRPPR